MLKETVKRFDALMLALTVVAIFITVLGAEPDPDSPHSEFTT